MLKQLEPAICVPMLQLFKASIEQNIVPRIWKCANVIPIHKKGDKSDPTNYRPVSLLATTGKMLEKIVFKYLFNHFRVNFSISPWQSGFMPGCSTICQLFRESRMEKKLGWCFLILVVLLTVYGMLVSCINYKQMALKEMYLHGYKIT